MFFDSRALLTQLTEKHPPAIPATPAIRDKGIAEIAKIADSGKPAERHLALVIDVERVLNRSLGYLIEPDPLLPGLCIFSMEDIRDIETGSLPLENARRYLDQIEQQHPHLKDRGQPGDQHPIMAALDELKRDGLELLKEDAGFIRHQIGHRMNWRDLLGRYKERWLDAMDGHQSHQRQNRGRFAANQWLLEVAE